MFHYTWCITLKGVTSLGAHLCVVAPGNTAPIEEILQWWRAVGDTMSDLNDSRLEPRIFRSRDERVTARPTGRHIFPTFTNFYNFWFHRPTSLKSAVLLADTLPTRILTGCITTRNNFFKKCFIIRAVRRRIHLRVIAPVQHSSFRKNVTSWPGPLPRYCAGATQLLSKKLEGVAIRRQHCV